MSVCVLFKPNDNRKLSVECTAVLLASHNYMYMYRPQPATVDVCRKCTRTKTGFPFFELRNSRDVEQDKI